MPGGGRGGEAGGDHQDHGGQPAPAGPAAQCDHGPGRVQCGAPLHGTRQPQARHHLDQAGTLAGKYLDNFGNKNIWQN